MNAVKMVAGLWQIQVLLFGTFWEFLQNIFDLWLLESADADPMDTEGQVYVI